MSETMCCPLSNDGDGPSCFTEKIRTARKEHRCTECRETITIGAKYECVSGVWDGRPDRYKTCLSCVEIRNHFSCNSGWVYGELWSQLEESFFPDMRAGGKCLDGLSPEAKGRMFEKRTAWLFRSGHEDDGAPPPTPAPPPPEPAKTVLMEIYEDNGWTNKDPK